MYAIRHRETKSWFKLENHSKQVRVYNTEAIALQTVAYIQDKADYEAVQIELKVVC